jgi:hypothetical protein
VAVYLKEPFKEIQYDFSMEMLQTQEVIVVGAGPPGLCRWLNELKANSD